MEIQSNCASSQVHRAVVELGLSSLRPAMPPHACRTPAARLSEPSCCYSAQNQCHGSVCSMLCPPATSSGSTRKPSSASSGRGVQQKALIESMSTPTAVRSRSEFIPAAAASHRHASERAHHCQISAEALEVVLSAAVVVLMKWSRAPTQPSSAWPVGRGRRLE